MYGSDEKISILFNKVEIHIIDHRTSNGLKFEQLETETKNSRKNLVFKLEKKLESRIKNPDRRGQFV